jgi:hypothetical protein
MRISETALANQFVAALRERLPATWKLPSKLAGPAGKPIVLRGPNNEVAKLSIGFVKRLEPKDAAAFVGRLRDKVSKRQSVPVIVAPYLGPRTRELLIENGAGYWDATGNFRLSLDSPALFIDVVGASKDPAPDSRGLKSLKGPSAGRIVRALCDFVPPYGIRELAKRANTPAPSLSRVVDLLDSEAIVERESPRGAIVQVDWQALIRRWARDYDFVKSNLTGAFLEPRGLVALLDKLRNATHPYAVTGTHAADAIGAAATAPRLAMVFVEDKTDIADRLRLRTAESGGNVLLAEPFNPVVFERTTERDGIIFAASSQVAVDLLTGPGRSPADGEALLGWMKEHEDAWRS